MADENTSASFVYLHPNENPPASPVSPVLDPTNYHTWSRSILTALSAKNKIEFVLGTAPQPSAESKDLSACNSKLLTNKRR